MRFGIIGGSYTARSSAVADEETINLFQETRQASPAAAPAKMYGGDATGGNASLFWTPGLSVFSNFDAAKTPVRGTCWTGSRLFAVAGNAFFEVLSNGTSPSGGTIVANDGLPVSMAFNGLQILIVSGGRAYCYTLANQNLLDVTDQLAAIPLNVQYDDTYFVMMFQNSDKAQLSNFLDGTVWPPLFVNEVSVFPENISSIITNHRELWVFGQRHAQVYQDTGSAEIFDVIPGAFIETGCVGAFVPCLLDNSVFWISEDERGARTAFRSNGYTPTRISTYAVEIDLASYPTLFGMTTYSYQDGGHLFWVLYVPGSQWSWVYDVSEGLWHKRASWNEATATWGPHHSWNHVFAWGQHLVGDWASGNIYVMSLNTFEDNGSTIRRLRRAPTAEDEMNWMFHSMLNLDFEMGNLSIVNPTDSPGYASGLLGPSQGLSSVNTSLPGGIAWDSPSHGSNVDGSFASCTLAVPVTDTTSAASTGTSNGGGAAWTTPENIDNTGTNFATVDLSAGGSPVISPDSGSIVNSANPLNQNPPDVMVAYGHFASTAATDATMYVKISGNITGNQGGGLLILNYSIDGGSTWTLAQQWNATFAELTVPLTISGITNLDSLKIQLIARCSCSVSGFTNVNLVVPAGGLTAVVSGSGQPTAQTLMAAVTGLTIPAGRTIVGLEFSFKGEYVTDPPALSVGLNVGNVLQPFTLTASPVVYTAGGATNLWGYDAWTAATLTSLMVNFYASSTGTTTVNLNTLIVTVHHVATDTSSDGLDVTHFGFSITAANLLAGITVRMECFADVTTATLTAQMLKGGVPVGDPQTLPVPVGDATTTPVQSNIIPFGALNSLFGASWTNADIAATAFGVRVIVTATNGIAALVRVGSINITLFSLPVAPTYTYIGPDPMLVDGDGNPRPPQVMVRWSDDRGKTWSNEHIVDMGNLGDYKARAIIRRLGRSRYRVYEISMSDPIPWVLRDAYLQVAE